MSEDWLEAAGGSLLAAAARRARIDRSGPFLRIDGRTIRSVARKRLARSDIVSLFLQQALSERRVRWRGIRFRGRENETACRAYCAMSPAEFEGINARQRWANWRVIPRNLDGHAPSRPLRAVDICCGLGHSTEVLAHYLTPGSEILGLDYNPAFVLGASRRSYPDQNGQPADVVFRSQSVLEVFRARDGTAIADESVDLVNSSGAVGSHFDHDATSRLAGEIQRILAPGGLAMIDAGPDGTSEEDLLGILTSKRFAVLGRCRSCFLDRFVQLCCRKP